MVLSFFRKGKPDGDSGNQGKGEPAPSTAASKRDPRKAKRFLEHAQAVADARNYDYAIECYINGLRHVPDKMDAHEALREVALKRKVAGGKPAGFAEGFKSGGKDPVDKLLQAETLWAKDPTNVKLMLGVMERAVEANKAEPELQLQEVVYWIGGYILEAGNQGRQKLTKQLFIKARDLFVEVEAWDRAVDACQIALHYAEDDPQLLQDLKNLEAERTMQAAQYGSGDFRTSVKNIDEQRMLDAEDQRGARSDTAMEELLQRRKAEYEEDTKDLVRMQKYVEVLLEKSGDDAENQAAKVLMDAWEHSKQFRYKMRAGDVRMKQATRHLKDLAAQVKAHPQDADVRKKYDEAHQKAMQFEMDEFTERVANYPTDMGLRFQFGRRLFAFKRFDEAIATFQEAQADPKQRASALQYLGMCYREKGYFDEAVQTFRRGIESHKLDDDQLAMDLRYLLMDALEQAARRNRNLANAQESQQIASGILQTNINYRDIRQRLEKIRALVDELQKSAPGA